MLDVADNCPPTSNADQADLDGDSLGDVCDADNDNVSDITDNCPTVSNAGQLNSDGDSEGNACDSDDDNDTIVDTRDNCPLVSNADQANLDGDSQGDACDQDDDNDTIIDSVDNCPLTPNTDQANLDNDSLGDACDVDIDNDTVRDNIDNCPTTPNTNQADFDRDGQGDACDADDDNDGLDDVTEQQIGSYSFSRDTDGDGIDDFTEYMINTSPTDRGSQYSILSNTICTEWNGFLGGMGNIVEHVNMSTEVLYVFTKLYDALGNVKDTVGFAIPPGAQFDLLVHDMAGRELDAYGKVCSEHSGQPGDLDGRMVYYKADSQGYEFAFPMPFINGKIGEQYVTLNTVQPSLRAEDASDVVANWIQITNLETTPQAGLVVFYNETGSVLGEFYIQLEAEGRFDVSGHQFGEVRGLVRWVPDNREAGYLVRSVRYLTDNPFGAPTYDSAFQLEARPGSGQNQIVSLAPLTGIEVSNTLGETQEAAFYLYDDAGRLVTSFTQQFAPYSSLFLDPEQMNPIATVMVIEPTVPESIIATAMTYGYAADGGINYFYGTDTKEPFGDTLRGSYNTFLNQNCTLTLVNIAGTAESAAISLTKPTGESSSVGLYTIPAKGKLNLDICSLDVPDTYGVVTVLTEGANNIYGTLLREGFQDQYRFPTPVRQ